MLYIVHIYIILFSLYIADIVFLVQTPDYLTSDDIDSIAQFIYNVTERLTIGQNDSLLTIITYMDSPVLQINKTSYNNNQTILLMEIAKLRTNLGTLSGSAATHVALEYLQTTAGIYDNNNAERLLIVIMSQGSLSEAQTQFSLFRLSSLSLTISVVGIGDKLTVNSSEPRTVIATQETYYHYVKDMLYLCWEVPDISVFIGRFFSINNLLLQCVVKQDDY